jgi:hypothetical protein
MDGSIYEILSVRGGDSIYTHRPFKKHCGLPPPSGWFQKLPHTKAGQEPVRHFQNDNAWTGLLDSDILKERKVCVNYATKYGKTYKAPKILFNRKYTAVLT